VAEAEATTGVDWDAVRASLDGEPWEEVEPGRWERRVFLGTVFRLYPSGKYYTPWANSNVDPCPHCGGRGFVPARHQTRRRMKKWQARMDRIRGLFVKRGYIGHPERIDGTAIGRSFRRLQCLSALRQCEKCGGLGSEEAYQDQRYGEALEAEAEERDLYIADGEGDPCDVFAGEWTEDDPDDREEPGRPRRDDEEGGDVVP
jgi:hypothetical protein